MPGNWHTALNSLPGATAADHEIRQPQVDCQSADEARFHVRERRLVGGLPHADVDHLVPCHLQCFDDIPNSFGRCLPR